MTHELKILPKYFQPVMEWRKTFELRKDDRDYHVGDTVILKEFSNISGMYTGRSVVRKISYVLRGCPEYGLRVGYCIIGFSLEEVTENKSMD